MGVSTRGESRNLLGCPLPLLHGAFVEAFSDYAVGSPMAFEIFTEFLACRSFRPDLSRAWFEGEMLLGFVLVGWRTGSRGPRAYDVATAVVPGARKRGIGSTLLADAFAGCRMDGIGSFLLEVLVQNEGARELYERKGFRVTRRLDCLAVDREVLAGRNHGGSWREVPLTSLPLEHEDTANEFVPTWQNSIASARGAPHRHLALVSDDFPGAWGLVQRVTGSVLQMAPGNDATTGDAALKSLGAALARMTESPRLQFLNVEDGSHTQAVLREEGWQTTVEQWEMELALAPTET